MITPSRAKPDLDRRAIDDMTGSSEIGDALVLFGATGDLARKKLHPALFRLVSRGRLAVPIIGVAPGSWGPVAADGLNDPFGVWHEPQVSS